jgi:crossover junction endodeoxyribonuclease RuvC
VTRPDFCLAIDPGLVGALALVRVSNKSIESIFDMPVTDGRVDPAKLAAIVDVCKVRGTIHAAVELVSSMPRQAGAFNFGVSAGVVHGVLGALGVPVSLVSPGVWKPACGLRRLPNESQASTKTRARELAIRLWPERAADFAKVKNDGRAEAALLARWFAVKNGWL